VSGWFATTTDFCLVLLFVSAGLCLYRLAIGPRAADRAVAFDTLSSILIGMICLLCIRRGSALYFDAVWILTLVGFLGSSAIARYLVRGRLF
jgi:multisubunit Na+/H+ antiporter MnhF subunit